MSQQPENYIKLTSNGRRQSSSGRSRGESSSNNQHSQTVFAWEMPKAGAEPKFAVAHQGPPGTEPNIIYDGKPVQLQEYAGTGRRSIAAPSTSSHRGIAASSTAGHRSIAPPSAASHKSTVTPSIPPITSGSRGRPASTLQNLRKGSTSISSVNHEGSNTAQPSAAHARPSHFEVSAAVRPVRPQEARAKVSWIDEAAKHDGQHGIPEAMYERVVRYWSEKGVKDIYAIQEVILKKHNFQMSIWAIYGILQYEVAKKSAGVDSRMMMPPETRVRQPNLEHSTSTGGSHIK